MNELASPSEPGETKGVDRWGDPPRCCRTQRSLRARPHLVGFGDSTAQALD